MTDHGQTTPLIERLRFRATSAHINGQGITAALHTEAADALESLYAKVGEDRQARWHLRSRLDKALARVEELEAERGE